MCTLTDGLNDDVDDGRGTDEDDDDDDGRGTNDDDDDEYEGEVLDGPFSFNLFLYSNKLTFFLAGVGSASSSVLLVPCVGSESAGDADGSEGVVTVIESDRELSSSTCTSDPISS